MRDVAIIGIGQIPVGEHWDSSLRMLAAEAIQLALEDAGMEMTFPTPTWWAWRHERGGSLSA